MPQPEPLPHLVTSFFINLEQGHREDEEFISLCYTVIS
jgi:hypothetical protein